MRLKGFRFGSKIVNKMVPRFTQLMSVISVIACMFMQQAQAALDPELRKMLAVMNVGTAFTVAPGFIVTNRHVVEDYKKVTFMRADETTFEGELVLDDPDNDLSLFYVNPEILKARPIPLAKKHSGIGAQVFTVGFPHPSVLGISPKLTLGHINAERGFEDNPNTYQISVPLQSGNSGGPLLDMNGNVVGITSWKLNAERMFKLTGDVPQNVNYAVKVGLLKKLMNDIPLKWKTRAESSKPQKLEKLVDGVKNSVYIVLAGSRDLSKLKARGLDPVKSEMFVNNNHKKQNIALFVHAIPFEDEMNAQNRRIETVDTFSHRIAKALKKDLPLLGRQRLKIKFMRAGKIAYRSIYLPDKKFAAQSFCRRHEVDFLLSVDYESDGNINRSVTMRAFDCESQYHFKQSGHVSHHYQDKFPTEVELRHYLRDFLGKLPSPMRWVGRE